MFRSVLVLGGVFAAGVLSSLQTMTREVIFLVENQGQCGSCWILSTTDVLEDASALSSSQTALCSDRLARTTLGRRDTISRMQSFIDFVLNVVRKAEGCDNLQSFQLRDGTDFCTGAPLISRTTTWIPRSHHGDALVHPVVQSIRRDDGATYRSRQIPPTR